MYSPVLSMNLDRYKDEKTNNYSNVNGFHEPRGFGAFSSRLFEGQKEQVKSEYFISMFTLEE